MQTIVNFLTILSILMCDKLTQIEIIRDGRFRLRRSSSAGSMFYFFSEYCVSALARQAFEEIYADIA